MMTSAVPSTSWSRMRRSRICAWTVASSAVVGSSAMIELRFQRERHRDHDPLAHAAGELVRVVVHPPRRLGNAHQLKQFYGRASWPPAG